MKRINHSVINWYELSLYKETNTAELKRYNRPATACDKGEVFIQRLTAEQFDKLAEAFAWFGFYHETEECAWYSVGVQYTGDCYRTGSLFRM